MEGAQDGQQGQATARDQEAEEEAPGRGQAGHAGEAACPRRAAALLRLFVAVRPPPAACAHLAAALERDPDPRWHVTLVFLGEQPDPGAFALTDPVGRHAAFSVNLEGVAHLGSSVGAGVHGDVEALQHLARDVRRACRHAGALLEHRRYRPHLTVARGPVPAGLRGYRGPTWQVSEVELVRSTLGRPVVHDVLARYPLQGVGDGVRTPRGTSTS